MRVQFQGTFMVDNQLARWRGDVAKTDLEQTASQQASKNAVTELDDSIRLRYLAIEYYPHYDSPRRADSGTDRIVVERRRDCGCLNEYEDLFVIDRDMPREESKTEEWKFLKWHGGGKVISPANPGESVIEFIIRAAAEAKRRWELGPASNC